MPRISRRPIHAAGLFVSTSIYATAAFATEPCFTSQVPTAAANAAAAAGAVSVAAADTSTNQILQVLQQRREEQGKSCPTGYILAGSSCEPQETASELEPDFVPVVTQSDPQYQTASSGSSASSGSASGSSSGAGSGSNAPGTESGSSGNVSSSPVAKRVPPYKPTQSTPPAPLEERSYADSAPSKLGSFGSWAEGYLDYEDLDGLTINGVDGISRKQTTSGYYSGSDLSFATSNGGQFLIGGLGGSMRIKQDFSNASRSGILPTEFELVGDTPITFFDVNLNEITYTPSADIIIDLPRSITSDIEQDQYGHSLGLYGSYMYAGWFIDGLFRADMMTLEQTTIITDTRITTIQGLRFGNEFDPRGNGNSCFQDLSIPGGDPAQIRRDFEGNNPGAVFGDPVTVREVIRDKVEFENYNFAARVGRRNDIDRDMGTWWEPSANITYLFSNFGNDAARIGFDDGHVLTLQSGARWGITKFEEGDGYFWTFAVGAYAFSDVVVDGFTASGFGPTAFKSEEGEVRALGTLQFSATWLNGTSWYTEGQIRGGEDLFGVGGKIGGRVQW